LLSLRRTAELLAASQLGGTLQSGVFLGTPVRETVLPKKSSVNYNFSGQRRIPQA